MDIFLTRPDAAAEEMKLATEVYDYFVAGKLNGMSCIGADIHEQKAIENRNEIAIKTATLPMYRICSKIGI